MNRPLRSREALGTTLVVLAVSNVAANEWLPPAGYVPWNLTVAAGCVAIARAAGRDAEDLGVDVRYLGRSVRVGATVAAVVAGVYAFSLVTGIGADAFDDERATGLTTREMLWQLFVRIPLGTVLVEEIIFRGVLPALFAADDRPRWVPAVGSSVLFGLWHILPSLGLREANEAVGRLAGSAPAAQVAAAAVVVTTVGGLIFYELRRRTRHVAAPVLVHLATNVLGFLGARFASGGASVGG